MPPSAADESSSASATRRLLLDVAAERFAARGYHATSFSDLVAASGLSRGAFYFHFASKHDLAVTVFRDRQERLRQQIMATVDADASPLTQFRQLWLERARIVGSDPSLRCLRRIAQALSDEPDMQDELATFHAGPVRLMGTMLTEAKDEGEVRADLDCTAVARVAFAIVVGIDELSDRESDSSDLVQRAEESLEVLLAAMQAH